MRVSRRGLSHEDGPFNNDDDEDDFGELNTPQ